MFYDKDEEEILDLSEAAAEDVGASRSAWLDWLADYLKDGGAYRWEGEGGWDLSDTWVSVDEDAWASSGDKACSHKPPEGKIKKVVVPADEIMERTKEREKEEEKKMLDLEEVIKMISEGREGEAFKRVVEREWNKELFDKWEEQLKEMIESCRITTGALETWNERVYKLSHVYTCVKFLKRWIKW